MLWQIGVLLATLVVAWLLARVLRRTLDRGAQTRYQTLRFGAESLNRAFFPLIGAVLVWIARAIAGQLHAHGAARSGAGAAVRHRLDLYRVFLRATGVQPATAQTHPWLFLVEKIVSIVVWIGMVLTVMGIQDDVIAWMAQRAASASRTRT